jgi:hypothetical protein
VSKDSKRARKLARAQAKQAIEDGDLAAAQRLALASPVRAGAVLAGLLGREPEIEGVLAFAERFAGELRRAGSLEAARSLARAGSARSLRLRVELALAAFAAGDDDEAEAATSGDPDLARLLAPLHAAARGAAPPKRRALRAAGLAELHAAAKAVSLARAGKPRDALRAVAGQPPDTKADLAAAIAMSDRPAPARAARLVAAFRAVQQRPVFASPALREAATKELAEGAPARAIAVTRACAGSSPELSTWVALRVAQLLANAPSGARDRRSREASALELARVLEPEAFGPEQAGSAWLYRGYALVGTDPDAADRAFDRAIAQGADLTEALRGRLLVARRGRPCTCGEQHGDPRATAAAAERLARALARLPGGAACASEAWLMAAEAHDHDDNAAAARAAVATARSGGADATKCDLLEAQTWERAEPARAAALVDGVLARDPEHAAARRLLARLARHGQAAPRSAGRAPFQALSDSPVTAGALAAELDRATRVLPEGAPGDPMTPAAWAHRDALGEDDRFAFDAAMLEIAERNARGPSSAERLAELAFRWTSQPMRVYWLSALLDELALIEPDRMPAARALAKTPAPGPLLVALATSAADVGHHASARDILKAIGPLLTRQEMRSIESAFRSRTPLAVKAELSKVARALEPDYALGVDDDPFDLPAAALRRARETMPPELRSRLSDLESKANRGEDVSKAELEMLMDALADAIDVPRGKAPRRGEQAPWP